MLSLLDFFNSKISLFLTISFCFFLILLYVLKPKEQSFNETVLVADEEDVIEDKLRILTAAELIETLKLKPALLNIQTNLGLSDENWNKDALPFLLNYIEFVQRLPASESHHHAGDGGLVKHTLDVAALALIASTAQSFPPNAKTEQIVQKTSVWRYGIMCAAILHDVGKTITSFQIELFENPQDDERILWLPDAGSMKETGKKFYRVNFPETKTAYVVHAEIAWTFFQAIVPAHVRQWIASTDPELMIALRSYLSNQKEGNPLSSVITKADMASVSRDLKMGSRQRFASAKRLPLIEIIMETLKEMLSNRGAYFSIANTAGGDLFRVGDRVYLMAKTVPDNIRQYLKQHQSSYAAFFPGENQRIFDTLLEYGAIITDETDAYRAVMNIEVSFTRSDGVVKNNVFSVLCFRLETLYPDGHYPNEFQGQLSLLRLNKIETVAEKLPEKNDARNVVEEEILSKPKEKPFKEQTLKEQKTEAKTAMDIDALLNQLNLDDEATAEISETEAIVQEKIQKTKTVAKNKKIANIQFPEFQTSFQNKENKEHKENHQSKVFDLELPKPPVFTSETETNKRNYQKNSTSTVATKLNDEDTAQAAIEEITAQRLNLPTKSPRPVFLHQDKLENPEIEAIEQYKQEKMEQEEKAEIEASADEKNQYKYQDQKENNALKLAHLEHKELGMQFLNWLSAGLADGSIGVNQNQSVVHFIDQGMLLVSPAIFRDYAGGIFNSRDDTSLGVMTQKGFERLCLHEKLKDGRRRTSLYRAVNQQGAFLFHCYLIPEQNIKHIIQPISRPQNNTSIMLDETIHLNLKGKE